MNLPGNRTKCQDAVTNASAVGHRPDMYRHHRRLLMRDEAMWMLQQTDEQFQTLIDTRQITLIVITGQERFDSRDIEQLIEAYKATAQRRPL